MSSVSYLSTLDARLSRLPKLLLVVFGVVLVGGIAALAGAVHDSVALVQFYIVPVVCVAWFTRCTWCGLVVAVAAVCATPFGALIVRPTPATTVIHIGAAVATMLLYVTLLWLVAAVRKGVSRREELALTDELTGVPNARSFRASADRELERSRRYRHQLSLLYLDIDDFKAVNDRLGHAEGDLVLREIAGRVEAGVRTVDTLARIGGDEFVILMPETGSRPAGLLAQRLSVALAEVVASDRQPVTCSLGLITFRRPPASVAELLAAGDRLMYDAKSTGKNTIRAEILPQPAVTTSEIGVARA
jgi:diguanylate cyclase (GGDEF)-like protein